MSTANPRPRLGIALGGGSARGWAHIGVLCALAENMKTPCTVFATAPGKKNAFHGRLPAKPYGWLADGRRRLSRELSLPEEISHSQNSFCDPRTKTRHMTAGIHRKYAAVQVRSVIEYGGQVLAR